MSEKTFYEDKEWHRIEALLTAIQTQLQLDRQEFKTKGVMRCWTCIKLLEEEEKSLTFEQEQLSKQLSAKGGN